VLMALTAIDGDGDPLTPNFPPIVMEIGAAVRTAPEVAIRSRKPKSVTVAQRLGRRRMVNRWRYAICQTQFIAVRPIRGP
jgi:hypothetical protein